MATAREHKATVTLAAVLGAFIICWLPYFIYFTCMGLRREMDPPRLTHSVVLWLGYFNSALNPILYPAINRDFRQAYSELLRCRTTQKWTSTPIRASPQHRSVPTGLQTDPDRNKRCGDPHLTRGRKRGV